MVARVQVDLSPSHACILQFPYENKNTRNTQPATGNQKREQQQDEEEEEEAITIPRRTNQETLYPSSTCHHCTETTEVGPCCLARCSRVIG